MKSLARGLVWWPGIDKDIESMVKKCCQCQQDLPMPPSAPLRPWSWPTRTWSRLLCWTYGWKNVFSRQTLRARFGIPESIVSDNGTQFTALEFERVLSTQRYCSY